MSIDIDKLRQFSMQVQLRELRPVLMTAELLSDFSKELRLDPSVSLEVQKGEGRFSVLARFGLRGIRRDDEPPVFMFKYHVVASYIYRWDEDPGDELLREFSETSSMVHLWPYFRAHVQTSASLLQFPQPLVIPTFIPGSLRKRVEESETEIAEEEA